MSNGICDTCRKFGKCDDTKNGRTTYCAWCHGYKPIKQSDLAQIKLDKLKEHLDNIDKDLYQKLQNAERDEEQSLRAMQSVVREIMDWL